jgi:hypothetical protein
MRPAPKAQRLVTGESIATMNKLVVVPPTHRNRQTNSFNVGSAVLCSGAIAKVAAHARFGATIRQAPRGGNCYLLTTCEGVVQT